MPKTNPINIRLEFSVLKEVKKLAKMLRLPFSTLLNRLIVESLKMFQCPGVIFTNSSTGIRRATVAGTGLDVWELISIYKNYNKDEKRLLKDYPLTQSQLNIALNYYEHYKKEIDEEIKQNEEAEESLHTSKLITRFSV